MDAGKYLIEFERIGRNKDVRSIAVIVDGEADLARSIRQHARPHLRSADFDVMIKEDGTGGFFACGAHNGGNFTIAKAPDAAIDYGPAFLARHADKGYPFGDRVPKRVRMTQTVTSDFIPGTTISVADGDPLVAPNGQTFDAWTNSYGAVAARMPDGRKLGLKPGEFEVVEWHQF